MVHTILDSPSLAASPAETGQVAQMECRQTVEKEATEKLANLGKVKMQGLLKRYANCKEEWENSELCNPGLKIFFPTA